MATQQTIEYQAMVLPARRQLDRQAAFRWLRKGWAYFNQTRGLSLAYGGFFALVGMAITGLSLQYPQFVLTFWSGFLLVGPLLAVGLYRIAQLIDRGERLSPVTCVGVLREKLGPVALFTLFLALIMIVWIRFSTLAAALYIGNVVGLNSLIAALATPEGLGFLAVLFAVGAAFAALMFALTAWSLPMMIDGRADLVTAVLTSIRAVIEQPLPMLTWGALVSALTLLGMLTYFAGFAVIFPVLGYATWAGYEELLGDD